MSFSSSLSSSIASVPSDLLQAFVTECIASLQSFTVTVNHKNVENSSNTLSQLRQSLLQRQHDCLAQFVANWNSNHATTIVTIQQVQEGLRNSPSHSQQQLDHTARLAFARLVLTTRLPPLEQGEQVKDNTIQQRRRLQRTDLLEFCGLCLAAVQLPMVQQYLAYGSSSSEDHGMLFALGEEKATRSTTFVFPHERLERIQQHFWNALNYDVQVVKSELQRLFFSIHDEKNEFTDDPAVQSTFRQVVTAMEAAIVKATHQAQEHAMSTVSTPTNENDTTTRVVAVQYSESLVVVDPVTGKEEIVASSASHTPPTRTLPIAAEQLQQEIWAELLSLRDEQRQEILEQAAVLARHVQETAMQLSDGSERIKYLQSMDVQTQKQLVMHKLWHDWIQQQHGGVEPAIRFQMTNNNIQ